MKSIPLSDLRRLAPGHPSLKGRAPVKRRGVMNGLEAAFDNRLAVCGFHWYAFEAIKLSLGGGVWWTPDFAVIERVDEPLNFYECKGSWKSRNQRDARTRIKIAAGMYPHWTFTGVTREGGEWKFEEFTP